ncbi:MAG TPA: amidohydrolase family protein, partial [bacterium]
MAKELNLLKNVLINTGGNSLQLVDVMFSNKVEQIIPHSKKKIIWNQISTSEKWLQFRSEVTANNSPATSKIFDGNFLLLIPGAIDPHVHFNTPGFESREDFEHGSLAAAHGGVTTVIDMPCTSLAPVTSSDNLKTK